jgi:hypothetical protein
VPSPFPGMNPFIEQSDLWPDFHTKFLAAINERLVPQVRPRYFVLLEQHVYVHEQPPDHPEPEGRADLSVAHGEQDVERRTRADVLDIEAPAEVELTFQETERVPYLEVRDRKNRELVTMLELLSPTNKRGEDRKEYITKRRELLKSNAHYVEIDLLRGGRPMPASNRPDSDYSVLLSQVENRPRAAFWPLQLRQRLPEIPIPLRSPDEDARIDLQELLHRVYDAYAYEDFIYRSSPQPLLSPEDEAWAQSLIAPDV